MQITCIKISAVLFRIVTWPNIKYLPVASAKGSHCRPGGRVKLHIHDSDPVRVLVTICLSGPIYCANCAQIV
jgi:hypothetical protein